MTTRSSTANNGNADALSRSEPISAATSQFSMERIRELQGTDRVLQVVLDRGLKPSHLEFQARPMKVKRWLLIWSQLYIQDGILFRRITTVGPHPFKEVLVVPDAMKSYFLQQCHDSPCAGHQGFQKPWIGYENKPGMAADVQAYCESCDNCHWVKDLPPPYSLDYHSYWASMGNDRY